MCRAFAMIQNAKSDYDRHMKGMSRRSTGVAESPEEIERRARQEKAVQQRAAAAVARHRSIQTSRAHANEAALPSSADAMAQQTPQGQLQGQHMGGAAIEQSQVYQPVEPGYVALSAQQEQQRLNSALSSGNGNNNSRKRKAAFAQPSRKRSRTENRHGSGGAKQTFDAASMEDTALSIARRLYELVQSGTPDVLSEGEFQPSEDDRKRLIEELSLFDDVLALYQYVIVCWFLT